MLNKPAWRCHQCAMRIPFSLVPPSSRTFATTQRKLRHPPAIPLFPDTSDPDLNSILADLRKNIFIPSRLNLYNRQLSFRRRHDQQLENAPVRVDIAGEEITLEPINGLRYKNDSCQESLRKILNMVKRADTTNRLQVLPGLLEGLNLAKRPATREQGLDILRLCLQHDGLDVAMQIVRGGARSGVSLRDIETTRVIAWGWHQRAAQRWKALVTSQQKGTNIWFSHEIIKRYGVFMELIRQKGGKVMQPGWYVWAVGLEIICWRAQSRILRKQRPGSRTQPEAEKADAKDSLEDSKAEVKAFITGLMQAWASQERDRDRYLESTTYSAAEREEYAKLWGPVLNSISLARGFVEDQLQKDFLEKAQRECLKTIHSLVLAKPSEGSADVLETALTQLYDVFWPLSQEDANKLLGYKPAGSKEASSEKPVPPVVEEVKTKIERLVNSKEASSEKPVAPVAGAETKPKRPAESKKASIVKTVPSVEVKIKAKRPALAAKAQ